MDFYHCVYKYGITLIKYIKNTYGKDELTDSRESYKDFRDYKRKTGQDIGEYISEFSKSVETCKIRTVQVQF